MMINSIYPATWLQLFAYDPQSQPPNYTGSERLTPEMKTYYDMTLLDEAQPNLVHDQFGQKRPIPQGSGKTIEFRKFAALVKALTPLTEGVTPDGGELTVTAITATVSQFGYFIVQTDVLELTAIDNTIVEATKLLGRQAGLTLDTITRNIIQASTNVSYAPKVSGSTETEVTHRYDLDESAQLTVDLVQQMVTKLRAANAPTINGDYVAIIHPYVAYDLMRDPEWQNAHQYTTSENIYAGEIGKLYGCRFVQSTEALILKGDPLTAAAENLTVKTEASSGTTLAVKEAISSEEAAALAGRKIYVGGKQYTIASATSGAANAATLTLEETITGTITANTVVYPGEGGKNNLAVFSTLFLAKDAYGVTEIEGGGLQTIVKQKGSAGTADPLDQRSSVGWKAIKTAKILIPDYLLRVESCSARYSKTAKAN